MGSSELAALVPIPQTFRFAPENLSDGLPGPSLYTEELVRMMETNLEREAAQLQLQAKGKTGGQTAGQQAPPRIKNKIFSYRDFLAFDHGSIRPLIGTESDALLVRGEAIFMPGSGGVGKTLYLMQMAINLCCAEYFLKWLVSRPLRVLISQAELPPQFFKKRIKAMVDSYALADQDRAEMIMENLFIEHVLQPFDISTDNENDFHHVAETVERLNIDVLMIDPFLSYYSGNENDNNQVRRSLDRVKRQVAEECQCGLVITDHQPKYSTSNKNPEQASVMRGASSKRDWAASVIALAKMKTPEGQHGTFIKATVDKMRYGKVPRDPFILRRDDHTFRHTLFRNNDIELLEIARVLDAAGAGLSTRAFWDLVDESFTVGNHEARKLIKDAIEAGWIETQPGEKRAITHHLTDKYVRWRDAQ
jgi:hypothetical protein